MKQQKRWFYAAIGVIVLLFAGLVYAWSVLAGPIAQEFTHWTNAQLSMTFTIVMICFCLGCIAGGLFASKISARLYLLLSAGLFFAGFFLAAGVQSYVGLYISFGVICGFASGISYSAAMGTIGKWFPDKQGLISGVLLMGFGISSFAVGKLYQAWTPETIGAWRQSFRVMGVITAAALCLCAFLIRKPPADFSAASGGGKKKRWCNPVAREADTGTMLRQPAFWLYYLWAILLSAAGLALVSQASGIAREIGTQIPAGTIATVVGLISVANGIGRLLFGALFDRAGRSVVMQGVNILFIVTALVLFAALKLDSFWLLTAGFILGGISYGGVPPTNSAFISAYYGMKHYPLNFSMINTNLVVASFGSAVAGALYDSTQSFLSTYIMLGCLGLLGILASLGISLCDRKSQARMPRQGMAEICGAAAVAPSDEGAVSRSEASAD